MPRSPVITLLTDFGDLDEYVGVMKGVILSIAPEAVIVDLTHNIKPQNIMRAAYMIKASYEYFPKGTVHSVVVDPGVGSERKIVALNIDNQFFLAPDNGVLSLLWRDRNIRAGVWVENAQYFLSNVSQTFHGRDIFAPVAARLSLKLPLERLGFPVSTAELKTLPEASLKIPSPGSASGAIVSVDRFGNLITNIDRKTVFDLIGGHPGKKLTAKIGCRTVTGLQNSYQSVPENRPLLIIGSRGFLEIAVNQGAADLFFDAGEGDFVSITVSS